MYRFQKLRIPNRKQKTTPGQIMAKSLKTKKEKIFKAARGKRHVAYRRARTGTAASVLSETLVGQDAGQHRRPRPVQPRTHP